MHHLSVAVASKPKPEICFDPPAVGGGSGSSNLSPSTVLPRAIFLVVGKREREREHERGTFLH